MTVPRETKPILGRKRLVVAATGPIAQELRYMTSAGGYVMCRAKGCMPFVMSRRDWDKLERLP